MTHAGTMSARASTYGAGTPLLGITPSRRKIGNPVVLPPPEWLPVIDRVCAKHRIHRKDVLAGWKAVEAVNCRNEVWSELQADFGYSLSKIGMMTGGFHHTTVMYGIRCHRGDKRVQKHANSPLVSTGDCNHD